MIQAINQIGKLWIEYFGFTVIQNTLFLGLVFLILYLFRNRPAKILYFFAIIGLLKCLLPPIVPAPFLNLKSFSEPSSSVITIGSLSQVETINLASNSIKFQISGYLFLIWILFAIIVILIPTISTIRLKSKLKQAEPVDFQTLGFEFLNPNIKIYKSDLIEMPFTIGLLPKKIYVPAIWGQWSPKCRKMILNHEMAHITRYDAFIHSLQVIVQALYFFHPLVWSLSRRLNIYREMACDDITTGKEKNISVEYSRILVEIAEKMIQTELGCSSASALIRQKNELLNRVCYQMEDDMNIKSQWKVHLSIVVLLLFIVPFSFTMGNKKVKGVNTSETSTKNEGKVYGHVFNQKSGTPLIGANVIIKGINKRCVTNDKGEFLVPNIPEGLYTVQASMMGFESVMIQNVKLEPNQGKKLEFKLNQTIVQLDDEISESQPAPPDEDDFKKEVYDTPPKPVGGFKAIQTHLEYPEKARKNGIEGRTLVYALIDVNGKVKSTKIGKSLGEASCDNAAAKAIKSVQWEPAMQGDKSVKVWVAVPVDFKLSKDKDEYDTPPEPIGGFIEIQNYLDYPESARKAGIEGKVIVSTLIDENGQVLITNVIQSVDSLGCDIAAVDAIRSVQWKPAVFQEKPVKTWIEVPISFRLSSEDKPEKPNLSE